MIIDVENKTVTLERKNCTNCMEGEIAIHPYKVCEKCKGTGRRGSGRCRNCRPAYPGDTSRKPGYVIDYNTVDHYETCPSCGGLFEGAALESFTEYITMPDLPIRVVRQTRELDWIEQNLAFGSIYNVVDYGRAWSHMTDEEIAEMVRNDRSFKRTQASHICSYKRGDTVARLCDEVVIIVARNGYKVVAYYE